jgi:hypothetical protein
MVMATGAQYMSLAATRQENVSLFSSFSDMTISLQTVLNETIDYAEQAKTIVKSGR